MQHLVGGISSAGRALPHFEGSEFLVRRSFGPYILEETGRRYIDTAMGFGTTMIGHAHPEVVEATRRAIVEGSMPAFAHRREESAAEALARHTGDLSKVVFTNSGSEAVHLALRIARAITGRTRVAKAAAGFDGWFDEVAFGNAGSPEADMLSNTRPVRNRTTLFRWNDFEDVDRLFQEDGDIAAVILEPMLANAGCIPAAPEFLAHVAEAAHAAGALVIADEVLMGFRIRCGLAAAQFGFAPDMATVGKAIGSGFPVAAVVGHKDVMMPLEEGSVVRAGTYCGNPMAAAAVTATMAVLERVDYPAVLARGDRLRALMEREFLKNGLPLSTSGFGTVFTTWPSASAPQSYEEAKSIADAAWSLALHFGMRERGALVMPSPFGRNYITESHDETVCDDLGAIYAAVAGALTAT